MQIETCRKVENALKRIDKKGSRIQVLPFHAAMTQESRLASMKEFARPPSKSISQFMICTDRYLSVLADSLVMAVQNLVFLLFFVVVFTCLMNYVCVLQVSHYGNL